jgi:hypothetical protein
MGILALYLKTAFSVEASFIITENRVKTIEENYKTDESARKMITRAIRLFYNSFNNIIVTNNDLKDWVCGRKMAIAEKNVRSINSNAHFDEDIKTQAKIDLAKILDLTVKS